MDLVPTQSQLVGHGLLAGSLQPGYGEGFKQGGKAAGGFGPGQFHHTRAVGGALAAGRVGVQDGAVLTGVQVAQIRGYADQDLRNKANPEDPSNRRVSLIVRYLDGPKKLSFGTVGSKVQQAEQHPVINPAVLEPPAEAVNS